MNYVNNWLYQLDGVLSAAGDTLPVSSTGLARLALDEGVVYALVLSEVLVQVGEPVFEVVHIVGSAGGGHTLHRGQEGTEPAEWPSGSFVCCPVTAAALNGLQQQLAALEDRVTALESGDGELPDNALVDSAGNALVNDQGDYLTYGV